SRSAHVSPRTYVSGMARFQGRERSSDCSRGVRCYVSSSHSLFNRYLCFNRRLDALCFCWIDCCGCDIPLFSRVGTSVHFLRDPIRSEKLGPCLSHFLAGNPQAPRKHPPPNRWHGRQVQRKETCSSRRRGEAGMKIAVIGAGAWGTALSIALTRHGKHSVHLWAFEKEVVESIQRLRINQAFLPGQELPKAVSATHDLET